MGGWLFFSRKAHALTEKDTIVLADFTNTTGDSVFDDTLKQALAVDLGQSPFLNILSEEKVRQTLREMTRHPDRATDARPGAGSVPACWKQGVSGRLDCRAGNAVRDWPGGA